MLVRKVLVPASPAQPKSPRAKRKMPKPQPQRPKPQRPKPLRPKPLQPKSLLLAEVELSWLVDDQEVQAYEGSGFAGNGQDVDPVSRFIDRSK